MEDNSSEKVYTPAEPRVGFPGSNKKSKSPWKFIALIIIVLLLGAVGAYAYFAMSGDSQTVSVTNDQTPTITNTPTQTPAPTNSLTKEKGELTVQILNGTGITGEANSLKLVLQAIGYSEDIVVGNADKTNYVVTEVYVSDEVSFPHREELELELSKIYQEVKITEVANPTYDVRIIIGFKKGAKATTTPTVRPTGAVTNSVSPTGIVSGTVTITPTKTPTP